MFYSCLFDQLPRHLREKALKDLLSTATNAQLDAEIVGHFILHPVEDLSLL